MITKCKANSVYFLLLAFLLHYGATSWAQEGYSSAAMSMSQSKSGKWLLPQPDEVVEEEYFNYHIHELPRPTVQQAAHLDAQWIGIGTGRYLVQLGLSTLRLEEMPSRQRVNVTLVVDRSGSMMSDEKMVKTRQAMLAFVDQLQAEDHLSIVTFDHHARIVLDNQAVGDKALVRQAINSIHCGGSTNMPAGIELGYQTMLAGVEQGRDNRMIILTDALTNTGVVDPEAIVQASESYRADVELSYSMIGVGINFNYQLSRLMTANGRDQVHFISNADDIQKVFVSEVESLLYPIGRKPQLQISLPQGLSLQRLYGYAPTISGNVVGLRLRDFNAGLSQIVLLEVTGTPRALRQISAELTFQKPGGGSTVRLSAQPEEARVNNDLEKNLAIAQMAASLKLMAEEYSNNNASAAEDELDVQIGMVKGKFSAPRDPDITHMLTILENYRKNVRRLANR
ncbi:MAG: VWA domain-containing protein [Bacteroidota bacterium]